MPKVVGVKFETTPKVYTFDAGNFQYTENCRVVVETARGLEIGEVKHMPKDISNDKVVMPLKSVVRIATEEDIRRYEENKTKKTETLRVVAEKAAARKLNMKFVDCEYTIDGSKLVLFFTADTRIDFRDLVKDIAGHFHLRIELRQIGARDECKIIGGYGPCGRSCCCVLGCEQNKVNIKMAKNQGLSLNPTKISGMCGRLMCCLAFENDYYAEINKLMPKLNSVVRIKTEDNKIIEATVVGQNPLSKSIRARIQIKEDTFEVNEYPLDMIIHSNNAKTDNKEPADDETDDDDNQGEN